MTILEGDRGLVVIDPLVSMEVARASLGLYFQHRSMRPVTTVIYTHSHTNHYGGVRGVVDEAQVKAGHVQVIAPNRFLEEIASEAVLAGPAMVEALLHLSGCVGAPLVREARLTATETFAALRAKR